MSKALKLIFVAILACICQTNIVRYISVGGIAPDMMIVFLVLITSYCGVTGGFCCGSLMSMFYDASVGYALAINMVIYTFIGYASAGLRGSVDRFFVRHIRRMKHKSVLVMMLICFFMVILRELMHIGYLFIVGAEVLNLEQLPVTLMRMVFCASYSSLMIIPCVFVLRRIMSWHLPIRKKVSDLIPDKKENHPAEIDV